MPVRLVEGKLPYTGGDAITVDENKVISLNLRDENNLIIYDAQDDEIYVDLQLPDGIKPTDAFPVGVTTGRVLVADGWDKAGTIISAKTTSGDVIKLLYADDGTLWIDNGTGTFKQIYFKSDIDAIVTTLTTYIDGELAKKQNGVTSATAPTDPAEGDLWYDTTSNTLKVYDGTNWNAVGTGGGGSDIEYVTQAEYNALLPGAESDGKHYFIYSTDGGGGWQPGVNTIAYYPLNSTYTDTDQSGHNNNGTTTGTIIYDSISGEFSSNNYINIPTVIPYGSNPFTISVWCNPYSVSGNQYHIFNQFNSSSNNTAVDVYIDNGTMNVWSKGANDWNNVTTVSANTWYNLILTYNGSTLTFYKNGTSAGTKNRTISSTSPNYAWIGKGGELAGPAFFDGKISNLIIENKVRTAQEVSDYYNFTKGNYGIS